MTISQSVVSSLKNYKYSENAFLPKIVTVPLTQEYNCSCKCLVKPGDYVKEGDVIAEPEFSDELNNLSDEEKQIKLKYYTKIHSPIPGKIIDVVSVLTPNGSYEKSVRIRLEGKFSYTGHILENNKINNAFFTKEQIIQTIADKGIVNTFFTPKPVSLAKQIDSLTDKANLIVRLYDDDTLRIADSLLTKFHIKEIIEGARIIASAMGAETRILFVGDIKSDLAKNYAAEITPKENETFLFIKIKKYPTGFKSEIINNFYKNYKKNAPFVISSNDLFVDTYSMYEVYNGVVLGKPVISRWVNFSGNCIPASCFLNVKIGYSLRDFMEQLGDFVHQPAMVVINGMLCGDTISKMNVPITKSVKSVEFISKANFTDFQIYNCVNCGNCRAACPMNLAPDLLYKNLVNRKSNIDTEIKIAQICIECGLCNTVCPARLPICQTISFLKNNKNDNTAKNTKNKTTDVIENNNPTDDKKDSQPINL